MRARQRAPPRHARPRSSRRRADDVAALVARHRRAAGRGGRRDRRLVRPLPRPHAVGPVRPRRARRAARRRATAGPCELLGAALPDLPAAVRASRLDQVGTLAHRHDRRLGVAPPARRAARSPLDDLAAELITTVAAVADRARSRPDRSTRDRPPLTTTTDAADTAAPLPRRTHGRPRAPRPGWVDEPYTRFTLRPLHADDRRRGRRRRRWPTLDDETFAELHRALLEWKVLFFRDAGLTAEQHHALGRRVGPARGAPVHQAAPRPQPDDGARRSCASRRAPTSAATRTCGTATSPGARCPSLGSLLRAIEVPDGRRRHAVGRHGRGVRLPRRRRSRSASTGSSPCTTGGHVRPRHGPPSSATPCVPTSRRSSTPSCAPTRRPGRKTLYVNAAFTQHIVGMDPDESDALLDQLYAPGLVPRVPVPLPLDARRRWRSGTTARRSTTPSRTTSRSAG